MDLSSIDFSAILNGIDWGSLIQKLIEFLIGLLAKQ